MKRLSAILAIVCLLAGVAYSARTEGSLQDSSQNPHENPVQTSQDTELEQDFLVLPDDEAAESSQDEVTLSDRELADLMYEMSKEDEGSSDFLVLPENYREPVTGLSGVYHLLLIGVDTDGKGITGRSDTMVLAVLDSRAGSIRLISFMRDLYVKIPGRGHNRLNAAYAFGGPDLLVKTLNQVFQLPIDAYLAVDFGLMSRLVDAVGGITMRVEEEERKSLNGILTYYHTSTGQPGEANLLLQSGDVRLDGQQAMAFSRIRKMDSDFERVNRQQDTLRAILEQVKSLGPAQIGKIVLEFSGEVKTDVSLSDAIELIPLLFALKDDTVQSLTIPIKGGSKNVMKNKAAFLVPNMKRNLNALAEFLYRVP